MSSYDIRLTVAGEHFDFDAAKLVGVFPDNVLTRGFAPGMKRKTTLDLDLESVKTIYAIYEGKKPFNQPPSDALGKACNVLGVGEILVNVKHRLSKFDIITKPKCGLTPEDARIVELETIQRSTSVSASVTPPDISLFDELRDVAGAADDLPYTLVKAGKHRGYVASKAEFIANFNALTFGIFTDMPAYLVAAGGAVLKCLTKTELPSYVIVNQFAKFMHLEKPFFSAFLDLNTKHKELGGRNVNDAEKVLIARQLSVHSKSPFFMKYVHHTDKDELIDYVANNEIQGDHGDIDLFLTTSDLVQVEEAIKFVYDRMKSVYTNVVMIRTEHSITFMTPIKYIPKVQIILRAYKSLEQVLVGFDVDSCCVGVRRADNGEFQVVATPRFIRAVKKRYNLVDPTRLSPTYEVRLMKYLRRGYGIAMTSPVVNEHIKVFNKIYYSIAKFRSSDFIGITKLAWLLFRTTIEHKSDYMDAPIKRIVCRSLKECSWYVVSTEVEDIVKGGKTRVPAWLIKMSHFDGNNTQQGSLVGPIELITDNVTSQGLFTGSFHPITIDWYEGGVDIPDNMRLLSTTPFPTDKDVL